jgi:hypothetical protein
VLVLPRFRLKSSVSKLGMDTLVLDSIGNDVPGGSVSSLGLLEVGVMIGGGGTVSSGVLGGIDAGSVASSWPAVVVGAVAEGEDFCLFGGGGELVTGYQYRVHFIDRGKMNCMTQSLYTLVLTTSSFDKFELFNIESRGVSKRHDQIKT